MAALHRRIRPTAWLVGAVGLALVVSMGGAPAVAAPQVASAPAVTAAVAPPAKDGDETSRPDSVSALVTARASGERVEDTSQRTETKRVYANPDGSWTSDTASQPESVQDDEGEWHDIETPWWRVTVGWRPGTGPR